MTDKTNTNIRDKLTKAIEERNKVRRFFNTPQMDQATYDLLVAARDRIKELEEMLGEFIEVIEGEGGR
jgi:hypothetical protein